jgi:hypothetical protein
VPRGEVDVAGSQTRNKIGAQKRAAEAGGAQLPAGALMRRGAGRAAQCQLEAVPFKRMSEAASASRLLPTGPTTAPILARELAI